MRFFAYVRDGLLLNLYVNAAVAAGLGSSLSHQNRTQAVNSANRNRLVVVDRINKCDNLLDERLIVALEEEPQRLLGASAVLGHNGRGVQQVVGIGSHALGAERLNALVIAVNSLTGVVDNSDAAVDVYKRQSATRPSGRWTMLSCKRWPLPPKGAA